MAAAIHPAQSVGRANAKPEAGLALSSGDLRSLLEQSEQMGHEYQEQEAVVLGLLEIAGFDLPAADSDRPLEMPGPVTLAERLRMEEQKLEFLGRCQRQMDALLKATVHGPRSALAS